MGKKIYVQRRGRGGAQFRSASWRRIAPAHYLPITEEEKTNKLTTYTILDIVHEAGRIAPLMKVVYEHAPEKPIYLPAVEGVFVGQKCSQGRIAPVQVGNVLPLGAIPEAAYVCNIELRPGDGGSLIRNSGSVGTVISKSDKHAVVRMPSGEPKKIKLECRAMIGNIASGGVGSKPVLKAGKSRAARLSRFHQWGKSGAVKMNPVDHPFGGGHKKKVKQPSTISRHAPPGKKVGLIAARRTGRRRGKIASKWE